MNPPFLTSLEPSDTQHSANQFCTPEVQQFVRLSPEQLSDKSDAELQAYILDCAERMVAAHARYEQSGNFADAGDRDYFWHAESDALIERGNRPHVVARMEKERGLA